MLRCRWGGDALNLAGVEDVPIAHAAQVVAGDLLLTRVLVLLLDGELAPFLDERGLGPLLEVPAAIANLVEGAPTVVREPAHVAHETEMEAVAALIHRAGYRVVGTEGGDVGFRPMESVAFHVLDNLLDHKRTLFLHDFKRLRFLLLFHFSPFRVSRWHHYINARGGPPDADFRWLKKKRPHRIVSAGSWEDGVEFSPRQHGKPPGTVSGCVWCDLRIFGLILGRFLHTRDEDGALVIDPDVIGAGDERDDLTRFRLNIEHHGGVRTRFAVPCAEVRLTLEVDALVALATVDYLREPRLVGHLRGRGLDEHAGVLAGEVLVLVIGDGSHGGHLLVVPEMMPQDDGVAAGQPQLLAIGIKVDGTGWVVVAVHVVLEVIAGGVSMGLQDGGVHGGAGDGDPADDIRVDVLPVIPIDRRKPIAVLHRGLGGRVWRGRCMRRLPAIEEEGEHRCGAQQEDS